MDIKKKKLKALTPQEAIDLQIQLQQADEEAARLQAARLQAEVDRLIPGNIFELKECTPESEESELAYPLSNRPEFISNYHENIVERAIQDLVSLGLVRTHETGLCGNNKPAGFESGNKKMMRQSTWTSLGEKTKFYQIFNGEMEKYKRNESKTEIPPSDRITKQSARAEDKKQQEVINAQESSVAKSTTACHLDQKLELLIAALESMGLKLSDYPWLVKLVINDMGSNTYLKDFFGSQEVMRGYIQAAINARRENNRKLTPTEYMRSQYRPKSNQSSFQSQIELQNLTETMDFFENIQCGANVRPYYNDDFNSMFHDLKEDPDLIIPFVLPLRSGGIEHWANIVFKGYLCIGPFSNEKCYLMPIYGIRTAWGCGGSNGFYFDATSNHATEIRLIKLIYFLNDPNIEKVAPPEIIETFNQIFFRQEAAKGHTEHDKRKQHDQSMDVMQEGVCSRAEKYTDKNINSLYIQYLKLPTSGHVLPGLKSLLGQPFINIPGRRSGGSKSKRKTKRRTNKRKTNKKNKRTKRNKKRTNKRRRI